MRIVIFGPPGAGKGTQSRLLKERLGLTQVATGDLIRAEIKRGTQLGRTFQTYIEEGKLVPDADIRSIAEQAVARLDYNHFILDGYPRTVQQATWLEAFLAEHHAPLHAVLSLIVPTENIVARLSQRRMHAETGDTYHLTFNPPPADVNPALIQQRPDDRPEAIRERLRVYDEQTLPVRKFYEKDPRYVEISGTGEVQEVHRRLLEVLGRFAPVDRTA